MASTETPQDVEIDAQEVQHASGSDAASKPRVQGAHDATALSQIRRNLTPETQVDPSQVKGSRDNALQVSGPPLQKSAKMHVCTASSETCCLLILEERRNTRLLQFFIII